MVGILAQRIVLNAAPVGGSTEATRTLHAGAILVPAVAVWVYGCLRDFTGVISEAVARVAGSALPIIRVERPARSIGESAFIVFQVKAS